MSKAATYRVKGVELADLQYFHWTHTSMVCPAHVQNGRVVYGEPEPKRDRDFCFSSKGTVYYGTNGGKASKTLAEIDADPNSEIVALDQFCDKRPTY